jgi:hypothetical protein
LWWFFLLRWFLLAPFPRRFHSVWFLLLLLASIRIDSLRLFSKEWMGPERLGNF